MTSTSTSLTVPHLYKEESNSCIPGLLGRLQRVNLCMSSDYDCA